MDASSSYVQWLNCAMYTALSLSKSTSKCAVYNCSLKADKLVSKLPNNNKALSFILHLSILHSLILHHHNNEHTVAVIFSRGLAVCKCNCLAVRFPEVAQDWDYSKNKATPGDHRGQSNKLAWWQSATRGSWQTSTKARILFRLRQQQRKAIRKEGLQLVLPLLAT